MKRTEFKKKTRILDVDYKKGFDRVDREKLWSTLQRGISQHLIEVIKSIATIQRYALPGMKI